MYVEESLDTVRRYLKQSVALKEHFGPTVQPNEPRGGMFLWVRFPDGVDTRKALEAAREEGVAYNPGPDWAVYDSDDDLNGHNYVRLCYALPTEEETWHGIERMAKVFQRAVGFP